MNQIRNQMNDDELMAAAAKGVAQCIDKKILEDIIANEDGTPMNKIRNPENMRQIKDFGGLSFGNGKLYPTDIDAFIEFGDRLFIFVEVKHGNAKMPRGQRLALERLCDAVEESGRNALVIVASHDTPNDKQINIAELLVTLFRRRGEWLPPTKPITVRDAIELFKEHAK